MYTLVIYACNKHVHVQSNDFAYSHRGIRSDKVPRNGILAQGLCMPRNPFRTGRHMPHVKVGYYEQMSPPYTQTKQNVALISEHKQMLLTKDMNDV